MRVCVRLAGPSTGTVASSGPFGTNAFSVISSMVTSLCSGDEKVEVRNVGASLVCEAILGTGAVVEAEAISGTGASVALWVVGERVAS